jgi:aldehyde:ferredoxin oxidoreductase
MMRAGSRAYNMLRMVAVREGCTSLDDDLPERFKLEALHFGDEGENAVTQEKLDQMLSEYYDHRQWDDDGKPTDNLINMLNLPKWT